MAQLEVSTSVMDTSILRLSKDILEHKTEQERIRHRNIYPEGGFVFNCKFPIKEIDNVPVNVIITLYEETTHKQIDLTIKSSKIYVPEDDSIINEDDGPDELEAYIFNSEEIIRNNNPKYTIEFIQEALKIIYDKLKILYFDKYNGKFMDKSKEISYQDWRTFLNIENITLDFNECCVCLEMTATQTPCKHSLCFKCWSNLKYTKSKKYNEDTIKCPYCRDDISF